MPLQAPLAKLLLFFSLMMMGFSSGVQADTEQADRIFREGLALYERGFYSRAFPNLEKAAEMGHTEAAHYAGEVIQKQSEKLNREAEAFYNQAAKGGNIYALLRLAQKGYDCSSPLRCWLKKDKWLNEALIVALRRARSGDPEAMWVVQFIYRGLGDTGNEWKWLQRAAEAGEPFSQFWLSYLIGDEKKGFYWTRASRQKDAMLWLRKAAENGYAKAMQELAVKLWKQGELEEARFWVEAMAKTDNYDALREAGAQIMMGPDIAEISGPPSIPYYFEKPRPIEGAALLLALHRKTGRPEILRSIRTYQDYLTPEMLAEALDQSEELLTDTPIFY